MATPKIPTDAEVLKQVRQCLSLDDDDDVTPVPRFLFEPIKQFMITNPDDDEFIIECHVPGKDTPEFGVVTCLEDNCLVDIPLQADPHKPDGGRAIGLGSFDAYRHHCRTDPAHRQCRDKRQESRKRREAKKAKAKAAAEASGSMTPTSTRSQPSAAMLSKTSSGSFSSLPSQRKAEVKPKSDVSAASSERKPTASALSRDIKPEVAFSNSKRTIGTGSKRPVPIFVISDSDDSDDDLKMRNKRLKPSGPMTAHRHSDLDRENEVQKQLKAIVSARKPDVTRMNAQPLASSTPPNAQSLAGIDPSELKPRLDQLGLRAGLPVQAVKPALPTLALPSGSASPAVPATGDPQIVTPAELDMAIQLAMCRKAVTLPEFRAFPEKIARVKQYLHYLGSHEAIKAIPGTKAVSFFPELMEHLTCVEEAVKADLRAKGRILPEDASHMSTLSISLAPQNIYGPGHLGRDALSRAMGLDSGFPGFEYDEDAEENRRLAGRNAEDLQTFFKDALDNFSENVTVAEAATKLGLAHMEALLPGMSVRLMPHQIIGVQWMVSMERGKHHGGILADSMGLGKTIQATATMVANPSDDPRCKTTLIVAPLALLGQWSKEIRHKTYGQLSILIFHGAEAKRMSKKEIKRYDVVLTTYGTLVQQFPPPDKPKKKKKQNDFIDDSGEDSDDLRAARKKHGPLAMIHWYRVILDEAAQIRNKRTRAAQACFELDAENRWVLSGTLIVNSLQDMYSYFHFLALSECSDWDTFRDRILKLEGKRPKTACSRIQAILKFGCMRRTKDTLIDGKPLLQLPEKKVEVLEEDFDEDERILYTAIEQKARLRFNRYLRAGSVLKNMRHVLIMILRLRQLCAHATLLVRKDGEIGHHDDLLLEAGDDRLANQQAFHDDKDINREDEIARARRFGGDVFVQRITEKLAKRQSEDDAQNANGEDGDFQCAICFEPFLDNERITSCLHSYCLGCITDITKKHQQDVDAGMVDPASKTNCPMCRESINGDNIFVASVFAPEKTVKDEEFKEEQAEILEDLAMSTLGGVKEKGKGRAMDLDDDEPVILPSAKMRKTSELVNQWLAVNDSDKIVIFSQFVSFINFVQDHLQSQGIKCYTYTGGMSKFDRDETISNFTDPKNPVRVILISTKSGGVGLNLTIANKAICLDLAWNSATEQQAIDRIHRIGQTKPVEVQRIVIPNSIEQRILALQEKKAALADGAYGEGKAGKLGRLSLQDLVDLFDARRDHAMDDEGL
ncbi:hypothetical protein NCC49_000308 [Naganishia albida]|nr:hypothetical protein NCC49_000308 [Naganishia albida]